MLQNLREHAQGWIAGLICGLLALAFALWGIQYYLQDHNSSTVLVKIDGYKITDRALTIAVERLKRQAMLRLNKPITFSADQLRNLKQEALLTMIRKQILVNAAKKQHYYISDAEVESALMQLPAFQLNDKFSSDQFQQMLSAMLYTPDAFYQELADTLLISQPQVGLTDSAFSLPNEIETTAILENQHRDFKYVILPSTKYINSVHPTAQQINQYYQQNQSQFNVPEQVKINYIEFSIDALKQHLTVSTAQLKNFYENNINNYSTPAQWKTAEIVITVPSHADSKTVAAARIKVQSIYSQLKAGENFEQLAKKYSEAPSAVNGGESAWFTASQRSPVLMQIISQLKPGQMSAPFEDSQGFTIIKLIGMKPKQVKSFESVQKDVKTAYESQALQERFNQESDKLNELTYTNPTSLDAAAKALHLPIKSSDWFTQKGTTTGITSNPKIVNAAFSDDVLRQGNNSNLIQLDDDTVIVLRVADSKPARIKSLKEVEPEITSVLKKQLASNQAQQIGEQWVAALQQGKKEPITWHNVMGATREQSGVDSNLLTLAFNQTVSGKNATAIVGDSLPNGDYAIVMVTKVVPGHAATSVQEKQVLANTLVTDWGQLDYSLYVKSLVDKTKIKVYDKSVSFDKSMLEE